MQAPSAYSNEASPNHRSAPRVARRVGEHQLDRLKRASARARPSRRTGVLARPENRRQHRARGGWWRRAARRRPARWHPSTSSAPGETRRTTGGTSLSSAVAAPPSGADSCARAAADPARQRRRARSRRHPTAPAPADAGGVPRIGEDRAADLHPALPRLSPLRRRSRADFSGRNGAASRRWPTFQAPEVPATAREISTTASGIRRWYSRVDRRAYCAGIRLRKDLGPKAAAAQGTEFCGAAASGRCQRIARVRRRAPGWPRACAGPDDR